MRCRRLAGSPGRLKQERGKRSQLTFCYTGLALQQQRAEDLLEQDSIDQMVQLVGDKAEVRQMIRAHLGRELEIADVITSLERLQLQPLFSHIKAIDSPAPWTMDIHLNEPDSWLPWLLGSVSAMVLPREWP